MLRIGDNILLGLVEAVQRHATAVITGAVLLTVLCLFYTATHLQLDTDTGKMLDEQLAFKQLSREYEQAFPQLSELIVVVADGADAGRVERTADRLAAQLQADPVASASVYRPGGGPFFARNGLLYLSQDELWTLSDELAEAAPFLGSLAADPNLRGIFSLLTEALQEQAGAITDTRLMQVIDRLAEVVAAQREDRPGYFAWGAGMPGELSGSGTAHRSYILVQPRLDFAHWQAGKEALAAIRSRIDDLQLNSDQGVRIRVTGSLAMSDEELESISRGAAFATGAAFALVCFILLLGLRSYYAVVAILATLFMGLAWTAAFAAAAIGRLNLISVSFAVLFIGLAVDFGIQLVMRYREEHNRSGGPGALQRAISGVGGSLMLAATTAAASFLAFVPTSYRGLAELGIIAAAGMFLALLANLTVLPALLASFPAKARWQLRQLPPVRRCGWCAAVGRRQPLLAWVIVLIALGAAVWIPKVRFDLNPLNMKDPATQSVAVFRELLADPDASPYRIQILAPDLDGAQALAARLGQLEVVDKVVTLASFVPSGQADKLAAIEDLQVMLGSLEPVQTQALTFEQRARAFKDLKHALDLARSAPQAPAAIHRLAHQFAALETSETGLRVALADLEQRIVEDLPPTLERLKKLLNPEKITLDRLPAELRERYLAGDGRARVEVFPRENMSDARAMRRFVAQVQAVAPRATGTPVSLVEGADVVLAACLQAGLIAIAVVFVLLLLVLRSPVDTVLVLLPLLLAVLLTLAGSVLLRIPLNLANIIALPLLIGLSVAFGIYLVGRWRRGARGVTLQSSSTGQAIFYSALTTMASFGMLALSDHRGLSSMGTLLVLALGAALLCTLIVLPAAAHWLEARTSRGRRPG